MTPKVHSFWYEGYSSPLPGIPYRCRGKACWWYDPCSHKFQGMASMVNEQIVLHGEGMCAQPACAKTRAFPWSTCIPELLVYASHDASVLGKKQEPAGVHVQAMEHVWVLAVHVRDHLVHHAAAFVPAHASQLSANWINTTTANICLTPPAHTRSTKARSARACDCQLSAIMQTWCRHWAKWYECT